MKKKEGVMINMENWNINNIIDSIKKENNLKEVSVYQHEPSNKNIIYYEDRGYTVIYNKEWTKLTTVYNQKEQWGLIEHILGWYE